MILIDIECIRCVKKCTVSFCTQISYRKKLQLQMSSTSCSFIVLGSPFCFLKFSEDWCFGVQHLEIGHSINETFDRNSSSHRGLELSCRSAAPALSTSSQCDSEVVKGAEVEVEGVEVTQTGTLRVSAVAAFTDVKSGKLRSTRWCFKVLESCLQKSRRLERQEPLVFRTMPCQKNVSGVRLIRSSARNSVSFTIWCMESLWMTSQSWQVVIPRLNHSRFMQNPFHKWRA